MSYPIQDGENIPEWLAKIVYRAYTNQYGNEQSYERMRERGGFGKVEVLQLLSRRWTKIATILQEADKALLTKKPIVAHSCIRLAITELTVTS